jgi:hypothetical protein
MEFRLLYAGDWLKSATQTKTRAWEKHALRKYFHPQLKELWQRHPVLSYYSGRHLVDKPAGVLTIADELARDHERGGIGFIPLVTQANGLVCELDILFLRPGNPGALLRHGGDIDNRIKVLLDSLRRPDDRTEMKSGQGDEPDPNPMYCLVQDDSLVTKLSVTVDRLLITDSSQSENSACVVITVTTKATNAFATPHELMF